MIGPAIFATRRIGEDTLRTTIESGGTAAGTHAATASLPGAAESPNAPGHVDALHWQLANAEERQQLLGEAPQHPREAWPDGASANEYGVPTLGAVAGARAVDRLKTTPQGLTDGQFDNLARTVRGVASERGLGSDIVVQGSRAARTARPMSDIDVGIRVSPQEFDRILNSKEQSRLSAPNPNSSLEKTRAGAVERGLIQAGEARLSTTAKAIGQGILPAQPDVKKRVDLSIVRRAGPFDSSPTMDVPSARAASVRATAQGAWVGGAVDGAFSAASALRDGQLTSAEVGDVLADSARGAAVGTTYAVTENGLVRAADRVAGSAIERGLGTGARIAGTRLAGAGAAGAVIGAGMSIYENRDGLARGESKAIGNVAGDVVVAGGSALAGAAAGAAIGSIVPGVGTIVGAGVGLAAGYLADQTLRAGGVDKLVGNAVSGAVDTVKGWFSW
jgi:hypothetical protein